MNNQMQTKTQNRQPTTSACNDSGGGWQVGTQSSEILSSKSENAQSLFVSAVQTYLVPVCCLFFCPHFVSPVESVNEREDFNSFFTNCLSKGCG